MGYAIFSARKIMLSTRINNLQFRLMALSQQKQNLAQLSSSMQQYFGNISMMLGSGYGMGMGLMNGLANSVFGMFMGNSANNIFGSMGYNNQIAAAQQMLGMQSQAMLKPVAAQENMIDNEMKTIETQLKAAQAEIEQVEKAEDNAIKQSAPKFA